MARARVAFGLFVVACLPACGGPRGLVVGGEEGPAGRVALEILAQALERKSVPVVRRPALGGARAAHEALRAGEIDLAVESTGEALQDFLGEPPERDAERAFATARARYRRLGLVWLPRLGWSESPVAVVRGAIAAERSLSSLTQLGAYSLALRVAVPTDFARARHGFDGLASRYGLGFAAKVPVAPGSAPEALAAGRADVGFTRATDPRIAANGLVVLADDLDWFPPWQAAPVARAQALRAFPAARPALEALAGRISTDALRRAAEDVAARRRTPGAAARALLREP